jgi:DNA modification methylase
VASTLLLGDSRELLAAMEPGSVSAIVTDPPYEIGFMGRGWDSTGIAYDPEFWALCLRVLSPGGHLVSFGACRTYHRIACAIEDAGFEIRDSILAWGFGSGFPKSLDISKAIDKAAGAKREVVGRGTSGEAAGMQALGPSGIKGGAFDITAPATPEARQWDGWGSALKPAHEPICLARKPLSGTIAATVLEYGTGGLNVDGCRVAADDAEALAKNWDRQQSASQGIASTGLGAVDLRGFKSDAGRWPPNVLLSPETAAKLGDKAAYFPVFDYGDEDRFFYAPKASREEREAGCEHLPGKTGREMHDRSEDSQSVYGSRGTENCIRNTHPTVKPVSLMRWLCRLITPPSGIVLDPFAGSGTTGIAAVSEGFDFIGIELDPDHHSIAMARIEHAASVAPETNRAEYVPPKKKQLGLF